MDAAIKSQSAAIHSPFPSSIIALLGPDHVRPASPADAVSGVRPKLVVDPGTEKELAEVLRLSNEAGLAVIPRGGGTKPGWGNPPSRADVILSTARLSAIIEHAWADLTVTVEAGCSIRRLQETLAQHGQRLALDPLWPEKATVGGVLSTNDSGALRLRFGALRDLIIGVTIAIPATFFTTLPPLLASVPSGRAMVTPMIKSRSAPKRKRSAPLSFVESTPPIVAFSGHSGSSANRWPCCASVSCNL